MTSLRQVVPAIDRSELHSLISHSACNFDCKSFRSSNQVVRQFIPDYPSFYLLMHIASLTLI